MKELYLTHLVILNWTFIIFEEILPVAQNIIDTVKYIIGPGNKNIRPIQKTPNNTTIFYNSNSYFDNAQDMSNDAIKKQLNQNYSSTN